MMQLSVWCVLVSWYILNSSWLLPLFFVIFIDTWLTLSSLHIRTIEWLCACVSVSDTHTHTHTHTHVAYAMVLVCPCFLCFSVISPSRLLLWCHNWSEIIWYDNSSKRVKTHSDELRISTQVFIAHHLSIQRGRVGGPENPRFCCVNKSFHMPSFVS